jgi:hypothetical protein
MENAFLNAQQMLTQLVTYIVLFILWHHAFRILKFISTSPLQEHAFVLKSVELLKTFPLDFTIAYYDIMDDKNK